MSGYINKQIVNERGSVQVVEGTLTDGSKVYDVQFRADGVLMTLYCISPEQADRLMIEIARTVGQTSVIVDSKKIFEMAGKVREGVKITGLDTGNRCFIFEKVMKDRSLSYGIKMFSHDNIDVPLIDCESKDHAKMLFALIEDKVDDFKVKS